MEGKAMIYLPKHNISLAIHHNEHKACYSTLADYLDGPGDPAWESEEHKQRALDTGELWEMSWYPDTPVGFHCIAAPTLGELFTWAEKYEGQK
jgi:hypothetical protein